MPKWQHALLTGIAGNEGQEIFLALSVFFYLYIVRDTFDTYLNLLQRTKKTDQPKTLAT
jgi:hypothetical protein